MFWEVAYYMVIYFFVVIPLHELGHMLMYYVYTRKLPKNITFSLKGIELNLGEIEEEKEAVVLLCGIAMGALPLFFLPYFMGWVMAAPYFIMGCAYDIDRVGKIMRNRTEAKQWDY